VKIVFPNDVATVVTTKTEREQIRRAETLLRHAGIVQPSLTDAANIISQFADTQEIAAEAEVNKLADEEE
jgi:hypothetical protein